MPGRTRRLARLSLTIALTAGLAAVAGCSTPQSAPASSAVDPDVEQVAEYMAGWFDSRDQARRDPDNYLDISLVMVPIWTERTDGRWLYVEQAVAAKPTEPYRQRVYRLRKDGADILRSDVFGLPGDPLAFAGAWAKARPLETLTPGDLTLRRGCSIFLSRVGAEIFVGATQGRSCGSTLLGAAYTTSQVRIEARRLLSWDRGWDLEGTQVWARREGHYVFVRRGDVPPRAG